MNEFQGRFNQIDLSKRYLLLLDAVTTNTRAATGAVFPVLAYLTLIRMTGQRAKVGSSLRIIRFEEIRFAVEK